MTATIDDNDKKVILKSDGTWQYKSQIKNSEITGTGIWDVSYFVDDFGDPTDKGYISNTEYLKGTFSNSATSNSKLNALMIIKPKGDIAIVLYEYAGRTPVKAYRTTEYSILVKDSKGIKHKMEGRMYKGGDRIYFDPSTKNEYDNKMHKILLDEGEISVVITKDEYGLDKYALKINADGYNNVVTKLYPN